MQAINTDSSGAFGKPFLITGSAEKQNLICDKGKQVRHLKLENLKPYVPSLQSGHQLFPEESLEPVNKIYTSFGSLKLSSFDKSSERPFTLISCAIFSYYCSLTVRSPRTGGKTNNVEAPPDTYCFVVLVRGEVQVLR